jgi:hypothetical protein
LVAVQRRQRVEEDQERVRGGPAELAAVSRLGERPDLGDHRGVAPQRGRQRRDARTHVPRVPDHDRVRAEELGPFGRVAVERAPVLLLALDQDPDPHRWPGVEGAQRAEVGDHVRLVIGHAAPVDRPVALGRLERRRAPEPLVAGGLDVVMRVEQHGRRGFRRRDLAGDDRCGVRQRQRLHTLDAGVAEQTGDEVVGLEQRLSGEVREGDRGDAREPQEIRLELGHEPRDPLAELGAIRAGR